MPACLPAMVLLLSVALPGPPANAADEVRVRGRPLLGVQRWDMYSGKGATQAQELGYLPGKQGFLRDPQWHSRAPFYCRLTKDVPQVQHPPTAGPLWCNYPFSKAYLQQAMDQEIRYAHAAGIDFFVYHGPTRSLFANAWELKNNLDAHMASDIAEAKKMKFVWALYGHSQIGYTRDKIALMMDEMIDYITKPNWQTVMGGRPLVPVLWPGQFKKQLAAAPVDQRMTARQFTDYIRARVKAAGLKDPYLVGMIVPAHSFKHAAELKQDGYDAFSDYAGGYGGAHARRDRGPTYAQATQTLLETYNRQFLNRDLPFIPPCTSMQYPWPRARDKQTGKPTDKWYHYQWPKPGDLAARVRAAFDFVAAHPDACEAQTVIMYSWNECSEGGGLIPTMGQPPKYEPVTAWLDEVAGVLKTWRYDNPAER